MKLRRASTPILVWALLCSLLAAGQSPQAGVGGAGAAEQKPAVGGAPHYPDDGYLAHDRYTNAFFGFWFQLPDEAYLKPIPLPAAPEGRIDLLELLGPAPQRPQISISAYPPGEKRPDAKAALRNLLDQELAIGVEELHALSKTNIAGHQFFYYETRRGIDQHAIYATELDGYIVRVILAAHDAKVEQQLIKAFTNIKFVPPASAEQYAGVGAVKYEGPSIPYHRLQELKSDPPAMKIDPGRVAGNVYENGQLGFAYELPKGWKVGHEGAVQPAVEQWRKRMAPSTDIGPGERTLQQACERVLFSAWKTEPDPGGDVLYEDFGEVTVSAMALSCFPNVEFPSDLSESNPIRNFLLSYGLSHPIMRDMRGATALATEGRTFVVAQGVVAYQAAGEALSRRVSIAMALTRQRGYLLSFFYAAPHDSDLRELMNAKALFDPEPTANPAKTTVAEKAPPPESSPQPGAAVGTGTTAQIPAAGAKPGGGQASTSSPEPAPSASAGSQPAADMEQTSQPAAEAAPSHPSLLRPGETMQDQQSQGKPLPKKNP